MQIQEIIQKLEAFAPPQYQEPYDNCGLLTGQSSWNCTGIICTLDVTEAVVLEAKAKGCNLIIAHHPIIFSGLKKINGKNYVEQTVIAAIKNDIAIYAIHTNLDNVQLGVNNEIANRLGLVNTKILQPKQNLLSKLIVFVPNAYAPKVRQAIFDAGAGNIGNYSECSFNSEGTGTFKANKTAKPFVGELEELHSEPEIKIEAIMPNFLEHQVIAAMKLAHPYEEVAFDVVPLHRTYNSVGSGMVGELPQELIENEFLRKISKSFDLQVIRHTPLLNKPVKTVAVCGGSGSFLIKTAISAKADFYITADVKYHEFFDAENKIVIADIGHWETEQYTPELIMTVLKEISPTFAVLKSEVNTNPIKVFVAR